MSHRRLFPLVIVLVSSFCLFSQLGANRFWDEDEGFFASTAAEMYARGDWIVPYFNGELFGHKPPFMYWMMMAGFSAFGVNEVGARVGSALFGLATALLTYWLGARLFSRRAGLIAGLVLPTCLMFSAVSRAATPDVFLTFFSSLALILFATWGFARCPAKAETIATKMTTSASEPLNAVLPGSWSQWGLIYAAMGLATLVKGPIGFLLPMAVIGMFLLCLTPRRELSADAPRWKKIREGLRPFGPINFLLTVWRMRPLTAIALVTLVAGPWFLAVGIRTEGAFLQEFFGVHHFQRFNTAMENHNGTIFYYAISILVGMFPWTCFAVPMAWEWWQRIRLGDERSRALAFLGCWVGVYIGVLSCAQTKLPNYILPAYPAVALICGFFLDEVLRLAQPRHLLGAKAAVSVIGLVGLVGAVGLPLAGLWEFDGKTWLDQAGLTRAVQREVLWLTPTMFPAALGSVAAFWFIRRQQLMRAVQAVGVTAALTVGVLWNYAAPRIENFQSPQQLAASFQNAHLTETSAEVAAYHTFCPSMVFYAGQPVLKCRDVAAVREFAASNTAPYLITSQRGMEELGPLQSQFEVVARKPNFPKPGELYLLRKTNVIAAHTKGRDVIEDVAARNEHWDAPADRR